MSNSDNKIKQLVLKVFKDVFAIDLVFVISIATTLIYGMIHIQEKYDKAVANHNKLYKQLNTKFLMLGLVDSIRIDYDQEPEETLFLKPKTVLIKVENESNQKVLIISCEDSKLPK